MPYSSDAQRRYFHAAANRGEIPMKTVKEFDQASKGMHLPERVKKAHGGKMSLAHKIVAGALPKEAGAKHLDDFPMSTRQNYARGGEVGGGYHREGHDVHQGIRDMIESHAIDFRGNREYRSFADEGDLNEIIPGMARGGMAKKMAYGGVATHDPIPHPFEVKPVLHGPLYGGSPAHQGEKLSHAGQPKESHVKGRAKMAHGGKIGFAHALKSRGY